MQQPSKTGSLGIELNQLNKVVLLGQTPVSITTVTVAEVESGSIFCATWVAMEV